MVQHYANGIWQGTMEVHDCLFGIFQLLGINPSISFL